MDTIPNGHNSEWHHPEWAPSQGHNPECTPSRMDTTPNRHNPEWTPSRMDRSGMDTIPNGYNPEWTRFRMSTYLVTEVFYTQTWYGVFTKKRLIKN